MELSLKMKECRENYGWMQFDLSQKSGVSLSTIKKYEAGLVDNFTYGNLKKISSAFNMTPASFIDEDNVRQMSDKCPTISQKNVRQMSDNISKDTEIVSSNGVFLPQTLNDDDIVSIPFYEDVRASAGSGAYNEAETAEQLNFPKSFLRQYFGLISFNNLSIIIGSGDSMFPTLPENCYLVIHQGNVKEGEICVARIEDELYVKRLQKLPKLKLFSDNKVYEPIELEGKNFEIIGRVVGYFKKTAL